LHSGAALHTPLDGSDPEGQALTYFASSDNPALTTFIPEGNRSLRFTVVGFGVFTVEMFEQRVPAAAGRIIELAESDFYDGTTFHRVINNFVIQGGDPKGDGSGGSGVRFDDQFHEDLKHTSSGLMSLAQTTVDDTNDSQFFFTEFDPTAPRKLRGLDFDHPVVGRVVEGETVPEAISNVATDMIDRPLTDVVVDNVEVFFDTENGVLTICAPEGTTGTATVVVTVTDTDGETFTTTFDVNIIPDTFNVNCPFNSFVHHDSHAASSAEFSLKTAGCFEVDWPT